MRLKDKVAFISGGARGMGASEGRIFAQEGAKVALGDIRDELGRQVAQEILRRGRRGYLRASGRGQRGVVAEGYRRLQ